MNILLDNIGLQNFGACLLKKCYDKNAIDDFLQICIQIVFYDKLFVSVLVPKHISNYSEKIIEMINEFDDSIFGIEYKNEQISKTDEIIKEIAIDFNTQIDFILENSKNVTNKNNEQSLPYLNDEMLTTINNTTKAIQAGDANLLMQLLKEASEKKNDSYFFDITTRNINSDESIIDKILSFNKKNKVWNKAMSLKLLSLLRISSNQILSKYFSSPYSPAVIRAKSIKQQRDILFLKIEDLLKKMNAIDFFTGDIELPSFEDYLLTKGRGNPDNIIKHAIELRNVFSPVRKYINQAEQKKKLNSVDYFSALKCLSEITIDVCNSLSFPSSSAVKKTIENVHILPAGPIVIPIPDVKGMKKSFSVDLQKCRNAFTEVSNDMLGNRGSNQYRNILIRNCVKLNRI